MTSPRTVEEQIETLRKHFREDGDEGEEVGEEVDEIDDIHVMGDKAYRIVQIEGFEGNFLMDDEENLYNQNLEQIGDAGGVFQDLIENDEEAEEN